MTAAGESEGDVGEIGDILGFHIRLAHGAVYRHFTESFTELGLTQKQVSALWLVDDHPGIAQTDLARRLRMPIHKVSVTAQVNLRDRFRELNADHYGALTTSRDGLPCCDLGYDNWMAQHILPKGKPLAGSPVVLAERCLAVRLPIDLSIREFDKCMHRRMRNAALNPWLQSPAGRTHCDLVGIAPAEAMRATGYGFGEIMRASQAQELYVFRPKGFDADRLIRIAERIIHDHVVATKRQMAAGWKSRAQGFGVAFTPVS